MPETISNGLTITIPLVGETGWSTTIKDSCFSLISSHDHTGSGKGIQIATSAIAADAVDDTKIRLRNDQFLRGRNAGASADVNIIKVNTSDKVVVANVQTITGTGNAISFGTESAHNVNIQTNNATNWTFESGGNLSPATNATYNMGKTTNHISVIFARQVQSDGNDIIVATSTAHAVKIATNNTTRWEWQAAGHLVPLADNSYDLASPTFYIRNLYFKGQLLPGTRQDYTQGSGHATSRTLNASGAETLANTTAVLNTLLGDLITLGLVQ